MEWAYSQKEDKEEVDKDKKSKQEKRKYM